MRTSKARWLVLTAVIVAGMVASSLLAGGGVDERGAEQRLRAFVEERQRAAAVAAVAPPVAREALWGETHDEPGELGIAAALLWCRADPAHGSRLGRLFESCQEHAAARAAAWPAIAPLAAGASRAAHSRWAGVPNERAALLRRVLTISRQHALDRGAWTAAVEAWLDGIVLFLDHRSWHDEASRDSWPEGDVARLDAPAARLLADGLARLEARWPRRIDIDEAIEFVAGEWLSGPRNAPGVHERLRAWREGFDPRRRELVAIDAFASARHLLAPEFATWAQRQAQWESFFAAASSGPRSWLVTWMNWRRGIEASFHSALAAHRLLRLAIAFQLGEPLPELLDPFTGEVLRAKIDGDVATFRAEVPRRPLTRYAVRAKPAVGH